MKNRRIDDPAIAWIDILSKRLPPSRRLRGTRRATSTLRCPENTSGFRFSSCFPTAAEIAASLYLPPAAQGRNSLKEGGKLAPSPRELSQCATRS